MKTFKFGIADEIYMELNLNLWLGISLTIFEGNEIIHKFMVTKDKNDIACIKDMLNDKFIYEEKEFRAFLENN